MIEGVAVCKSGRLQGEDIARDDLSCIYKITQMRCHEV